MQAAGKGESGQMTVERIKRDGVLEDDGKKAILVVSFGTSYEGQRRDAIGAVERAVGRAFPGWEIRRAFTSQMIINHLREKGQDQIDNVEEALKRLLRDGYRVAAVQPTHVMNGLEYDKMMAAVRAHEAQFDAIYCGSPLLNSISDYEKTAEALARVTGEFQDGRTAIVCMGHGTEHEANVYAFAHELSARLLEDQIVVVGNGSANVVCGHANIMKKGSGLSPIPGSHPWAMAFRPLSAPALQTIPMILSL